MVTLKKLRIDPEKARDGIVREWCGLKVRLKRGFMGPEYTSYLSELQEGLPRDPDGNLSTEDELSTQQRAIARLCLEILNLEEEVDGVLAPVPDTEELRYEMLTDPEMTEFQTFVALALTRRQNWVRDNGEAIAGN